MTGMFTDTWSSFSRIIFPVEFLYNCGSSDVNFYPRSRARPNGATQTFRRPSLAAGLPNHKETSQTNSSSATPSSGVYVPPHLSSGYQSNSNRHAAADTRYSKEQLLDLFRAYSKTGQATTDIDNLFVDGWNPGAVNGTSNGGWSKKEDYRDTMTGPEICWDYDGQIQPLGLIEMSEAEREVHLQMEDIAFDHADRCCRLSPILSIRQ